MNRNEYLNESDLLGNGTCLFHTLSKGGAFHYHRQIEIAYVEKGAVTIYTGTKTLSLCKNQFAVIKPYELHKFDGTFRNKCVCPILPDIYSNKLSQLHLESCVIDDPNLDALALFKMYPFFHKLSPQSRLLYFNNIYQYLKSSFAPVNDQHAQMTDTVFEYIHNHFDQPLTVEKVATACNTNHSYVSAAVNKKTHMNFNSYVNRLRLSQLIDSFHPETDKIIGAALQAGFDSPRTFYRVFKQEYGMTPGEYFKLMINAEEET